MVLTKEYRICMPLRVEEYQVGQLYMIARHSLEQSGNGEGVEVIENKECTDEEHGKGQFTEKRIHLSSRLPYWIQAFIPKLFYVTEKSWNYFPYTVTEYTCSFLPRFQLSIRTKYENNNGCEENCLKLTQQELNERIVDHIDIAYDDLSPKHYKEEEDPKFFKSKKTNRGPLVEGWRTNHVPIMCSYKVVSASFEMFGFQTKVEEYLHSCIREILLLGHRQAFTWIDEWYEMTLEDVREYEANLQLKTNTLLSNSNKMEFDSISFESTNPSLDIPSHLEGNSIPSTPNTPNTPITEETKKSGYFSWF